MRARVGDSRTDQDLSVSSPRLGLRGRQTGFYSLLFNGLRTGFIRSPSSSNRFLQEGSPFSLCPWWTVSISPPLHSRWAQVWGCPGMTLSAHFLSKGQHQSRGERGGPGREGIGPKSPRGLREGLENLVVQALLESWHVASPSDSLLKDKFSSEKWLKSGIVRSLSKSPAGTDVQVQGGQRGPATEASKCVGKTRAGSVPEEATGLGAPPRKRAILCSEQDPGLGILLSCVPLGLPGSGVIGQRKALHCRTSHLFVQWLFVG